MVVIAVIPAATGWWSIGKSIPMIQPNLSPSLVITGGILEQIGWRLSVTSHPLYLTIGGSWAKKSGAAGLSFILINRTGAVFEWHLQCWLIKAATDFTQSSVDQLKLRTTLSALKLQLLIWKLFVGIISGFVGATAFNNTTATVNSRPFFLQRGNALYHSLLSYVQQPWFLSALWPWFNQELMDLVFGCQLTINSSSIYYLVLVFLARRLLLPFGLLHVDHSINYTQVGGSCKFLQVLPKIAWTRSTLVGLGSRRQLEESWSSQYQHLLHAYTPARFKSWGQVIRMFGIFDGYCGFHLPQCGSNKKEKYKGCFYALATFLTGVTEQLNHVHVYCCIIYALVQVLPLQWLTWLTFVFTHSVQSNSWHVLNSHQRWFWHWYHFNFVWVTVLAGFIMYFITNFIR